MNKHEDLQPMGGEEVVSGDSSHVPDSVVTKEILDILDKFPPPSLAAQQEMAWYNGDDEAVKAVDIARTRIDELKQKN